MDKLHFYDQHDHVPQFKTAHLPTCPPSLGAHERTDLDFCFPQMTVKNCPNYAHKQHLLPSLAMADLTR